jgi:hypothetical protein
MWLKAGIVLDPKTPVLIESAMAWGDEPCL